MYFFKVVVFKMSLSEKRVAELILLYLSCQISPEQHRELMEGYVNLCEANRLHFEKITDLGYLRRQLMDRYYTNENANGG